MSEETMEGFVESVKDNIAEDLGIPRDQLDSNIGMSKSCNAHQGLSPNVTVFDKIGDPIIPEAKELSHIDEVIAVSPEKLHKAFEDDITRRAQNMIDNSKPIIEADPALVKEAAEKAIRFVEEQGNSPLNKDIEDSIDMDDDHLPEDLIKLSDEVAEEIVAEEADKLSEEYENQEPFQLDEKDPLNQVSEAQINNLLKNMRDMMGFLEAQWNSSKEEFKITDNHMKLLYDFNEHNRVPPTEEADPDDENEYDKFNGLDKLTYEQVVEIFGLGHPIIATQINEDKVADPESTGVLDIHQITIDRIKSVVQDFFAWMSSIKEYRQLHDAYIELIEIKEDEEIKKLQNKVDECEDPETKVKLQESLDQYYSRKYLDFLADPLPEDTIDRLVKTFSDENKVRYWMEKTRMKLKQLKLSDMFILEISQFEKRFLDEKYHHQSNIFLLYFLNLAMKVNAYDKRDLNRGIVVCIVIVMDKFIRNTMKEADKIRIINNMEALQNQFLGKLPKLE